MASKISQNPCRSSSFSKKAKKKKIDIFCGSGEDWNATAVKESPVCSAHFISIKQACLLGYLKPGFHRHLDVNETYAA